MAFQPNETDVNELAERMYASMFVNRATRLADDRYGIADILKEKARAQLIREASSPEVSVDA